jgi:hypothetical protein
VTDVFPTLEVVLAVCVLWLGFRDWFLFRGATTLRASVEDIAKSLEAGSPKSSQLRAARAPWLSPFTRTAQALLTHQIGTTAARELVSERSQRARRKLTSGAARDLVVCAVLIGSLIYARAAQLEVGPAFFPLGILATVMLVLAVALRLTLERGVASAATRVAEAIARRPLEASKGASPRCRICRETKLSRVASAEALGRELSALGVVEVFVCPRCGHVTGAAHPPPTSV